MACPRRFRARERAQHSAIEGGETMVGFASSSRAVFKRDMRFFFVPFATGVLALSLFSARLTAAEAPQLNAERIKSAVAKSIALVEKSSAEYRSQRQCFGCHHQAAPVLMLVEARRRGFAIDEQNFNAQLDHTAAHLKRGIDSYRGGQGQGGKADTAGWALWTLETGGRQADEATAAVADFLLSWHSDQDHWRAAGRRPPTEASDFATTYVALRGLASFGDDKQQNQIDERRQRALRWTIDTEALDTEDRVFRLQTLDYLSADQHIIEASAQSLLQQQNDDGGWAQTDGMTSDAYATGTALVTLHETGHLSTRNPRFRKGADFLLGTQHDDGSWRVATRSKPIQVYFESGFPHGKDQFISISATSWATTALLLACPLPSQ